MIRTGSEYCTSIKGNRLTFQLFAQVLPFAHLATVYRSFDRGGPLNFVKDSASLSDNVMARVRTRNGDGAISQWYNDSMKKAAEQGQYP